LLSTDALILTAGVSNGWRSLSASVYSLLSKPNGLS